MMTSCWYDNSNVDDAVKAARESDRPILADFWSPTCRGCAKLFKVTYGDPDVRAYLDRHFILVKYNTKKPNEWFKRLNGSFGHFWHPNLVVLDSNLIEMHRSIGYLLPAEFQATLEIGRGLHEMYHGRPDAALNILRGIAETWSDGPMAAQALYWAGVAAYRLSGSLEALAQAWTELATRYPASDWTMRADCLDISFPASGFDPGDESTISLVSPANR